MYDAFPYTRRTPYPEPTRPGKTAKLDPHTNPAFRPPLPLPGGLSPTWVPPRSPTTHGAASQTSGPRQPPHRPVSVQPPLKQHTHSLRTHLYRMSKLGLATTALLQDAFKKFYGDGWEEAYKDPSIKDFFLREVREEISREAYGRTSELLSRQIQATEARRTSAYNPARPPLEKCPCPLHELFGVAEELSFPTCPRETESSDREWEGLDLPRQ